MESNPSSPWTFLTRHAAAVGRYAGLLGVIVLFGTLDESGTFLTGTNFRTVATQTVIVAIAALGATMVIIGGGIDLSVGSVIAISMVVTALGLRADANPFLAISLGILVGGLCGLVNGLFITGLRIVPFIATLGMLSIARGTAKWIAGGATVTTPLRDDPFWLEEIMVSRPLHEWMVLAPGVWLMIALSVAVAVLLGKTVFGRHIFAVGSNESTARLCGLPVFRIKVQIYALAGLLSGVAGVLQYSRLTVGDPTSAVGLELDVIAAVVIGGGSLSGGEGSVAGTLIGAFILQLLRNGCNLLLVDNFVQEMIIGGIIVLAVAIDQLRKRSSL